MKSAFSLIAAVTALAFALPAQAQFAKPEDAVKYRKAGFTLMANHFGRLGAMASGKAPFDAKAAAENADLVAALAKLPWVAFGEGPEKGETRAKPEIWKESAKFKEAADKMQPKWANCKWPPKRATWTRSKRPLALPLPAARLATTTSARIERVRG